MAETAGATFTDLLPDPGAIHEYRISATDAAGNESALGDPWTKPDWVPPATPAGLVSRRGSDLHEVILDWTATTDNVGVTGYNVYRGGVPIGTSALPMFTDAVSDEMQPYMYQVSATDAAGNESELSAPVTSVNPQVPSLQITSPVNGQTVTGEWISVVGTVNSAVTQAYANGRAAMLKDGAFSCDLVPLAEGTNDLVAIAYNKEGQSTTAAFTVVRTGGGEPLHFTAAPTSGVGPLRVQFATSAGIQADITTYQWDLDGDGVFETESATAQPQTHAYSQARLYYPRARMVDSAGVVYTAVTAIRVGLAPIVGAQIPAQGPSGLAVDAHGNLHVSERTGGRVVVHDANGALLRSVGALGTTPGYLTNPKGVAVDPQGNVFVVDRGNGRVQEFDAQGAFVRVFGEGLFTDPYGVTLDRDGNLYITDLGASLISQFSPEGHLQQSFGGPEAGVGQLNGPRGLCFVGTDLYVADSGNHRIARFSTAGGYQGSFGTYGAGEGQLSGPSDVAWDATYSQFLVADTGNNRVVLFDRDGGYLRTLAAADAGVTNPLAVVSGTDDTHQYLYVAGTAGDFVAKVEILSPAPDVVWNQMKDALAAGDVEGAVSCFAEGSQDQYRSLFTTLQAQLPEIAAGMAAIQKSYVSDAGSEYKIRKTEVIDGESVEITYYIYFVKDEGGQWKIKAF